MLIYILKVTLCWSLFYLLYHLWLSKETFFRINRWYLIGTALLSLTIPALDFGWAFLPHEEPIIAHYLLPITVGVEQLETVIVSASAEQAGFDWQSVLITIYWTGVGIALARFIGGLFKINSLYKHGEKAAQVGYNFISTHAAHAPFSFFKNLFWSKNFEVSHEDRENILRHEEAHIFQWHSADVVLFELLSILFWCSPFVYLYRKAIKTTHEYLADDFVVAQASRKNYGRLLLRQSQSGMPIAISNSFSSQLKQRIVMMTKNRSNRMASLKYLAGLPLIALLFLAFSFGDKVPNDQPKTTGMIENQLKKDTFPSGNDLFKVTEEMPRFPGCDELPSKEQKDLCSNRMLMHFISKNLKYPKSIQEQGIEGTVFVDFIIEKDGSVSNAKIARSVCEKCDEEVLRVVNEMPKWNPGKQRGKEVRVQFSLPIKFKMTEDPNEGKTYIGLDVPAAFKGCEHLSGEERKLCSDKKMLTYIPANVHFSKEDISNRKVDVVLANFMIGKDGKVKEVQLEQGLGNGLNEEIIRVMENMPLWTPAEIDGKSIASKMHFNLKFQFETEQEETIFKVVEEMPHFPGCEKILDEKEKTKCWQEKMLMFIYNNIKYPAAAREKGIEGLAVVSFVIEKDGSIADAEIVRSIGGECDEEVLKVVYMMPNWIPGKQRGKAVRTEFKLPVKFKLEGGKKKTTPLGEVDQMPRFSACDNKSTLDEKKGGASNVMLPF